MRYGKKMNRYETREFHQEKMSKDLHGEGLYVYENRSAHADLQLPKPTLGGKRFLAPSEQFQGDNYFMAMVARNELKLIRTIQEPKKEGIMSESKLILDQPDQVTRDGKVEHVVDRTEDTRCIESSGREAAPEVLLTEDPMAGVEILDD